MRSHNHTIIVSATITITPHSFQNAGRFECIFSLKKLCAAHQVSRGRLQFGSCYEDETKKDAEGTKREIAQAALSSRGPEERRSDSDKGENEQRG